jgi:predicted nuclease of predicted toxin-antitoxin system
MSTPLLRFLADESCDFAIIRALRAAGYDVLAVSEHTSRSDDRQLIEQAYLAQRILLTEDSDFGRLVFASHADSAGIIFIRFPGNARSALAETIAALVAEHGEALPGAFVVVQPGYIRITHRPGSRGA